MPGVWIEISIDEGEIVPRSAVQAQVAPPVQGIETIITGTSGEMIAPAIPKEAIPASSPPDQIVSGIAIDAVPTRAPVELVVAIAAAQHKPGRIPAQSQGVVAAAHPGNEADAEAWTLEGHTGNHHAVVARQPRRAADAVDTVVQPDPHSVGERCADNAEAASTTARVEDGDHPATGRSEDRSAQAADHDRQEENDGC
jgi:hypothetical protein